MTPLELALRYIDLFFNWTESSRSKLETILATDMRFIGPLFTADSAADYLDDLQSDPPAGMTYDIIAKFESVNEACLVYDIRKDGIHTRMAQLFQTDGNYITQIILIFDASQFR